jgi:hypothetical protein
MAVPRKQEVPPAGGLGLRVGQWTVRCLVRAKQRLTTSLSRYTSPSGVRGHPPRLPLQARWTSWSEVSGMVAVIPPRGSTCRVRRGRRRGQRPRARGAHAACGDAGCAAGWRPTAAPGKGGPRPGPQSGSATAARPYCLPRAAVSLSADCGRVRVFRPPTAATAASTARSTRPSSVVPPARRPFFAPRRGAGEHTPRKPMCTVHSASVPS